MEKTFQQQIEQMKKIARSLTPLTFPQIPYEEEQDTTLFKQRCMQVDGYTVVICYSEADHGKYSRRILQIQSVYTPFLPFVLICKLGRLFLGSKYLSYAEFLRGSRKIYCWTVKVEEGEIVLPGKKTRPGSYEGFDYRILNPGSIDLR